MKVFSKILLVVLLLPVFFGNSFAQAEKEPVQGSLVETAQTEAPPLGEDDRLPFMQREQAGSTEEPSSSGLFVKTLGAMLLILGVLFFGAWVARKWGLGGTEQASRLKVLSTVTVASGQTLSAVRFGENVLLVGSTPQSITLLADQPDDEPEEFEVLTKPHSVAEMLAGEIAPNPEIFQEQLTRAGRGLGFGQNKGGRL